MVTWIRIIFKIIKFLLHYNMLINSTYNRKVIIEKNKYDLRKIRSIARNQLNNYGFMVTIFFQGEKYCLHINKDLILLTWKINTEPIFEIYSYIENKMCKTFNETFQKKEFLTDSFPFYIKTDYAKTYFHKHGITYKNVLNFNESSTLTFGISSINSDVNQAKYL